MSWTPRPGSCRRPSPSGWCEEGEWLGCSWYPKKKNMPYLFPGTSIEPKSRTSLIFTIIFDQFPTFPDVHCIVGHYCASRSRSKNTLTLFRGHIMCFQYKPETDSDLEGIVSRGDHSRGQRRIPRSSREHLHASTHEIRAWSVLPIRYCQAPETSVSIGTSALFFTPPPTPPSPHSCLSSKHASFPRYLFWSGNDSLGDTTATPCPSRNVRCVIKYDKPISLSLSLSLSLCLSPSGCPFVAIDATWKCLPIVPTRTQAKAHKLKHTLASHAECVCRTRPTMWPWEHSVDYEEIIKLSSPLGRRCTAPGAQTTAPSELKYLYGGGACSWLLAPD